MLDWENNKHKNLLNQAVGSVKFLADQRDLHQIALLRWVSEDFILADQFIDGSYKRELWLSVHGDDHDIAVEITRCEDKVLYMRAQWVDQLIKSACASMGKDTAGAETVSRWAGIALFHRDKKGYV
jgi:hypothetical protein